MALSMSCSLAGTILLATTLVVSTLVAYAIWRQRQRKKKLSDSHNCLLQQLDGEYPYDIFVLCSDKDEAFVRECIEIPLKECGYTTLRKNTAPNGLFTLGSTIVSDIDCVIKLCCRVIVVCSENYHSTGSATTNHCGVEINCCKEMVASRHGRVIPIILDGVKDTDFTEFTQHRVKSSELVSNLEARADFIRRLKRDMNIRRISGINT